MSRFELEVSSDGVVAISGREGRFTRRSRVRVDGRVLDRHLSHHFAGLLADLVDVGMAAYAADRLCPRPRRRNRYDHFWHRRIHITLPVRTPERWGEPEVRHHLQDVLAFLTEDDWTFDFVPRAAGPREVQGQLFDPRPSPPLTTCLFSRGLDSVAGLTRELRAAPDTTFVLFGGYTHPRLAKVQRELACALQADFGARIRFVQVPFGIRHETHSCNEDDRTQRSRGFAHGLLGSAIAIASGGDSLRCYENGVGALNLPLTDAQLGAQNARSAHPVAAEELAHLVRLITGRPFRIELPCIFETKASMCRPMRGTTLEDLVPSTVSCDSFPLRIRGKTQCGHCSSCVLRRQALRVAGLSAYDPPEPYRYDLHDAGSWNDAAVTYPMSAMLYQVAQLQAALGSGDPWYTLSRTFPRLEQTVLSLAKWGWNAEETRAGILRLYSTYCDEWDGFAQQSLTFAA